jgi:hypothetical protein
MWSVSTIITGLISFMLETAPTLGSIESTDAQKRNFAKASLDFNVKDTTFCKLFPELVELHKETIRLIGDASTSVIKESRLSGAGAAEADDVLLRVILAAAAGFVALVSILFAMRII